MKILILFICILFSTFASAQTLSLAGKSVAFGKYIREPGQFSFSSKLDGMCVPNCTYAPDYPDVPCSTQTYEQCNTANHGGCEWRVGRTVCVPGPLNPEEMNEYCSNQTLSMCVQAGCDLEKSFACQF